MKIKNILFGIVILFAITMISGCGKHHKHRGSHISISNLNIK